MASQATQRNSPFEHFNSCPGKASYASLSILIPVDRVHETRTASERLAQSLSKSRDKTRGASKKFYFPPTTGARPCDSVGCCVGRAFISSCGRLRLPFPPARKAIRAWSPTAPNP